MYALSAAAAAAETGAKAGGGGGGDNVFLFTDAEQPTEARAARQEPVAARRPGRLLTAPLGAVLTLRCAADPCPRCPVQTLKYVREVYARDWAHFRERLLADPAVRAALEGRPGAGGRPAAAADIEDTAFLPGAGSRGCGAACRSCPPPDAARARCR